jgi:hypothetical protein
LEVLLAPRAMQGDDCLEACFYVLAPALCAALPLVEALRMPPSVNDYF